MRVVQQLIDHLRDTGHLTPDQLSELRRMGMVKDEPAYDSDPASGPVEPDDDDRRSDALDAFGDRLIDEARRAGTRARKAGAKRSVAASRFGAALASAVAELSSFLEIVDEIAQRVGVKGDADAALRAVAAIDAATLDAALTRDSLWSRLWHHTQTEFVFDQLSDSQRRRLSSLVDAPGFASDPTVRRATNIVLAQRVLAPAFGRAVSAVGPKRALAELNLSAHDEVFEVAVILHSARMPWHTIAELPDLGTEFGLPVLGRLAGVRSPGWEIAARIDPVKVLPFMQWCMTAWAAMPATGPATGPGIMIGPTEYVGNWRPLPAKEWFSIYLVGSKWTTMRRSRHVNDQSGEVSQTLVFRGSDYFHVCPANYCSPRRIFQRADGRGTLTTWPMNGKVAYTDRSVTHAHYGALWAAGLFDMPLLTCPKEWESK